MPTSTPYTYVTLIQLESGDTVEAEFFQSVEAHIYKFSLENSYSNIDISEFLTDIQDYSNLAEIIDIKADNVFLEGVDAYQDLLDTQSSFFIDGNDIYIHLQNNKNPYLATIEIDSYKESYRHGGNVAYYGDRYYADCVKSIGTFSQSLSDFYDNIQIFDSCTISFINFKETTSDSYHFDALFGTFAGRRCKILYGEDGEDIDDFSELFLGVVESDLISNETYTLNLKGRLKYLNKSFPPNIFDSTTYPYLDDNNIGKVIPLAWGNLRNVPVICTNEEEAGPPANYNFKICDCTYHSIYSIDTVYVNGSSVTPASTDLTTGTFVITQASGDYTPGDDVTANINGYKDDDGNLIEDGIEIIKDIFYSYFSIAFNNYSWDLVNTNTGDDLPSNLYVNSNTKVIDSIRPLLVSSLIDFFIKSDGRITARIFNEEQYVKKYFHNYDIKNYYSIQNKVDKIITSTYIGYNKDYKENKYVRYLDDSLEISLEETYKTMNRREINTNLTEIADVQTISEKILNQYGDSQGYISFVVELSDNLNIELGDVVAIEIDRPQAINYGSYKLHIRGLEKNPVKNELKITGRIFAAYIEYSEIKQNFWTDDGEHFWTTAGDGYDGFWEG